MWRTLFRHLTLGVLTGLALAVGPAVAAEPTPEQFVKSILARYVDQGKRPAEGVNLVKRADYLAYFAPETAKLLIADRSGGEIGEIDYDPFICAQDFGIKKAPQITKVNVPSHSAVVTATFENLSQPTTVHYLLERTNHGWRVADTRCSDQTKSLMEYLKPQ